MWLLAVYCIVDGFKEYTMNSEPIFPIDRQIMKVQLNIIEHDFVVLYTDLSLDL